MWVEVYAAIYKATCDDCGKKDQGWFFLLNGTHRDWCSCADCHSKVEE